MSAPRHLYIGAVTGLVLGTIVTLFVAVLLLQQPRLTAQLTGEGGCSATYPHCGSVLLNACASGETQDFEGGQGAIVCTDNTGGPGRCYRCMSNNGGGGGGGGGTCSGQTSAIKDLSGLDHIIVYERTSTSTTTPSDEYSFKKDDPAVILSDINESAATNDFATAGYEYYDIFYSDAGGAFNANGSYITIQDYRNTNYQNGSTGHNIDAVKLVYTDGHVVWADAVTHVVLGTGLDATFTQQQGYAAKALSANNNQAPALGDQHASLTLGFCAAFPQSSSNGSVASSSGSNGSNSSVGSNGSSGSNGSNGSSGSNGSTGSNGSNGSSGSNGSTGSSGSNGSTGSNASGASSNGGGGDQCAPICGDGVIVGNETCDDGNTTNGDGCSSTCKREGSTSSDNSSSRSGGSSSGNGSSTSAVCGNGRKEGAEDCDDGNTTNGDGCSSTCKIEQCYVTPPPPPNCASTPAGESLIEHVCAITANGNFACQQHAVTLAVSATARVRGVYTWDTALRDLGFAATGQICGTATVTVAVDGAVTRRFDDTFGVATIPSRLAFDLDLTAGNHAIDVRAQGSLQNCTVNGQQQPSATPTRWKGKLSFETIACSAASSSGGGNSSGAGSSVGAPGGQCPAGFNPLIIGGAAGCPNGDPPPCNGTLEANGSYTDQDGCNNVCYRCNTSSNSSAGVNAGGQCAAGYSDLSQGGAPPGESCPIGDPRPCPSGQVREYGQGYIEPNGCRHICTRCVPA